LSKGRAEKARVCLDICVLAFSVPICSTIDNFTNLGAEKFTKTEQWRSIPITSPFSQNGSRLPPLMILFHWSFNEFLGFWKTRSALQRLWRGTAPKY
ncbi:MAG: hypothetical protein WAN70_00340, partial [Terriglobales bacterium]